MLLVTGLWACDSLSDPEKNNTTPESTARVMGALQGSVPTNARVAIVWQTRDGLARGADVAVVDGKFSMDLGAPPEAYLFDADDKVGPGGGEGDTPDPTTDGLPVAFDASIGTQTTANGTTTGLALRRGEAGFIVYLDENGNHELDFDENARAVETIVGAEKSLVLTFFADGTTFDYEKLGDGKSAPHEGYNLYLVGEGNGQHWFPLDSIQLKVGEASLPISVCGRLVDARGVGGMMVDAGTHTVCNGGASYVESCMAPAENNLCAAYLATVGGSCDASANHDDDCGLDAGLDGGAAIDASVGDYDAGAAADASAQE